MTDYSKILHKRNESQAVMCSFWRFDFPFGKMFWTMRYHLTPGQIKTIDDSLCWSKRNIPLMLVGLQICTVTLEISMVVSQKIEKQSTSRPSYTNLGRIHKGYSIISQGHLLNYIHSSIIHNSQNLVTTQIPLNREMDQENVVHLHNGVLLSCKKQGIIKFAGNGWN